MFMMPFQVLGFWLRALVAIAMLGAGIALMALWYNHRETTVVERRTIEGTWIPTDEQFPDAAESPEWRIRSIPWRFGLNRETAFLIGGLGLLLWSMGGGWAIYPRMFRRQGDRPNSLHGEKLIVRRSDGSELHVEMIGPVKGIPIVFIHGWSLNSNEWAFATNELARDHRLITWDLAGLGKSTAPNNRDFSLEKMARDLDAIVDAVSLTPSILLGHSIGGMIILTYCRLFPEKLGRRVRGLVVAQSTYTNPVKTAQYATLLTALQKPLLVPMAYLMIWISPVARLLNWMSYMNGSAHRSTESSSFSGNETRDQLDFLTRLYVGSDPATIGRGFLAMFDYDATSTLSTIPIPVLIVTAEADSTCLPEASEFMKRMIPSARLHRLSGGRHCGVFEFHEEFHDAVAAFINESAAESSQNLEIMAQPTGKG